jgi:HK97 family phage major capsid protein
MKRILLALFSLFVASAAFAGDASLALAPPGDLSWLALSAFAGAVIDPEQIRAELKRIGDDVKAFAEKALGEVKAYGKITDDTKAQVDQLLLKQGEYLAQLREIEQVVARLEAGGGARGAQAETAGQRFVNNDAFRAWAGQTRPRGRFDMTFNALITTLDTDADGSAGDLAAQPTRVGGILELPQRRLTVRDLISPGRMDGDMIEYLKETGFTNNAGMVPEGVRKPESTIKFDKVTTTPKVIAHFMKATRQILSDA